MSKQKFPSSRLFFPPPLPSFQNPKSPIFPKLSKKPSRISIHLSLSLSQTTNKKSPEMETKFHGLPPLKRFRLMQQQQEEDNVDLMTSLCLPTKKRKESRDPVVNSAAATTTYCLPAKKRVWALSSFDLNVEYEPSLEEEKEPTKEEENETLFINGNIQSIEKQDEEEEEEEEDGENDDDGIVCAICQSTDGDAIDPIVLCDGCDLMVHATCYGNPLIKGIPEGDWFCHQCSSQPMREKNDYSCCLCPSTGGAVKPTCDGRWAHVVCALFVPEVYFRDPEGRDGIDCSKVPPRRWEEKCYVCDTENGCVIDCSELKCALAFHITCGLKEELSIEYKQGRNRGAIVAGFCKDHTELWKKQQQTGKFKIVAMEDHKK